MDYYMTRLFDDGKLMAKHVMWASRLRGSLSIRQEDDSIRRRATLVARFTQWGANAKAVPPLYDAVLISSTGNIWVLAGYEKVLAGPLQQEHYVGQSWQLEPAVIQDQIDADNKARGSPLVAARAVN